MIGSYKGRTLHHEFYFKSTGTDRDIFYWKLQGTEHQSNYYFSFKSTRTDRNINYRIGSYRGWNITHQTDKIFSCEDAALEVRFELVTQSKLTM